ncbi:calcineurin-like phosphoesterase C-terminal domain-containing protein [Olivibacter sp. SDN3]|uniref:calcineurin-like phosphoesterase C-terminal domain-containing protein n=1 Tax=Olivibacter sp. SDN3 TaxID=2764720 RepID=UPI001651801C|nr:calcineurin-like phosphoesterase family protein [Olivibacter sp. SDN3]QNL49553.1 calcineurin-like phosphoesterase C-terminal domain-containing protein [Olivibacter sp. SDN3]
MKKISFLCSVTLFLATLSYGQDVIKGFVYHDTNGNNKKDRKEIGISGVSVSNGQEVVQTDNKGYYELPQREDQVIFVIKPRGYQSPLDENNLPKNHYIHKPQGSPAHFKYKGVAPTGPMPTEVNFALLPQDENDSFKALIFGDPQAYNEAEIDYFSKGIIEDIERIDDVSFGLSLGDLVGDDLSLHSPYIQAVKKVGLPWYNLMGNHDMNYDAETDSLADETYEANFGPANYAFNYGKVHFIVLDDILYPDPRDGKGYWGGFREDQLQFIENDLKYVGKDQLIVLAFHIPLLHENEDAFRNADRQRLFELLKDYPHTLSLSAHTHLQRQNFYAKEDGWQQEKPHHEYNAGTTSGDWYSGEFNAQGVPSSTMRDGTPKGYAYINFKGNQYAIDYKVAGKPADYQMELFAPKVIPANKNTSAGIYANFFMGAEGDEVLYRVDGGEWKAMHYVRGADPNFLAILHKYDHTEKLLSGRRPSNPEECTHLWRAPIPAKLSIGSHQIEVKATDRYGKVSTQSIAYEIAEE